MIIGIGNDVIDIRRIEETLEKYGERFVARIFTDVEIRKSEKRAQRRPPTPSDSQPRRRVPRRWAPASGRACSGRTWGW
jgi:phosphopantetheinyl transferase (holo-ACP synthase)